MKLLSKSLALLGLLFFTAPTIAQERLSSEDIQKYGTMLLEASGKPADAQIKVDATPDKGDGIKHEGVGAIFLPDRKLTVAVLDAAGTEIVPVGTLWLKQLVPANEGKAIATEKLRTSKLKAGENEVKVTWYLVGAKKTDGKLELVIFGSEKAPIVQAKLESDASTDSNEKTPVYLTGEKEDDNSARLFMSILGKYKATVTVVRAAE